MKISMLVAGALALLPATAVPPMTPPPLRPHARDSAVAAAREAIAAGRPWMATRLLAPVLRDSTLRTPEVEYLAATASAGWRGWTETLKLLQHATWLDTAFDGGGYELQARAALGLARDSLALRSAGIGVRLAVTDQTRGERLVLQGLAAERVEAWDSAAAAFQQARPLLPSISDWLGLRAASVTRDSARRLALFASIGDSLIRARMPAAAAAAVMRSGDTAQAIVRYEKAGQRLSALRLRVAQSDSAGRRLLRDTLVAFIGDRTGSSQARLATRLLDSLGLVLTTDQELQVARSATVSGPLTRAVEGYKAVFARRTGAPEDQFALGELYFRLGRYDEAIAQYRKVKAPPALAAAAGYRVGRSMVRSGRVDEARTQLTRVIKTWPRDTSSAVALYLLADLATDDHMDGEARQYYARLIREHRQGRLAAPAAFRAALIAYADSLYEVAGTELDSLEARYPQSGEAVPALYWAGRAWHDAGDTARARARWREVMERDSASYYAEVSARRLGVPAWAPARVPATFVAAPDLEVIAGRADLLEHVMLAEEASAERARLTRLAGASGERLLAAADIMARHHAPAEAISLARRAQTAGVPRDSRVYRLMYPLGFERALVGEAARAGVDPALVAALIRQESLFNPEATSVAGARGLMQVMPDVGKKVARSLGYEVWDPVLLYQGDANLEIGTTHLKALLTSQGNIVEVLAAYNAGGHRVVRWRTRRGAEDPELLAERIPYVETRDYVRIVQRNRALYRAIYDWADGRMDG